VVSNWFQTCTFSDEGKTTDPEAILLKLVEDISQRVMMCVQFHLTGAVKKNVVFSKLFQAFLKPFVVMFQFLEGV
jgi:hypothetical protein